MLFDSHAHINNADMTEEERQAMVAQIEASDLDYVMDIGFDPASSALAAEHAARYPWCWAAVGCHPHDTKDMDEEKLELIRRLAAQPKVAASGEIGLDFHYDLSERDVQRQWFRRQIRLANELRMPICIHAREADQEVMDILKEEGAFSVERKSWFPKRPDPAGFCGTAGAGSDGATGKTAGWDRGGAGSRGAARSDETASGGTGCSEAQETPDARVLLHCFSGSAELARQYVRLGATISVAGPVTYKNNRKTVGVVEAIPLDFLLVETDSPYLSPVPMRGKPNTPPYVEYTCRKVAEIKGISYGEAAAKTRENAKRFYGIG